jgi:L-rhamnose mutarotase
MPGERPRLDPYSWCFQTARWEEVHRSISVHSPIEQSFWWKVCELHYQNSFFFLVWGSHSRIKFDYMKRSDQQKKWVHSQLIIIKKKTKRSAPSHGIIVGTNRVTFSRGGTAVGCPWDLTHFPLSQLALHSLHPSWAGISSYPLVG